MAVAGLQNVSDFGPSFFVDSQRTRASTLLQMWREIEGENVNSQSYTPKQRGNGSDSECVSTTTSIGNGSENGDTLSQTSEDSANHGLSGSETDNHSVISEQSIDLGEMERERVRQIFQEWMNTGPNSKGYSSYGFGLNNHTEQWVGTRRPIRRLCGRQTLLDLLQKAHNEWRREILSLSEQRPVSNFVHRNRIQALLKGRFLRNDRSVLDRRPSSVAASELGLLRPQHVKEGFLSKLDSSASSSVNEPDSLLSDENNGESESTCREGKVNEICTSSDVGSGGANREWSTQELEVQVTEAEDLEVQVTEAEDLEVQVTESSSEFVDINDSGPHEVYNAHDVVDHSSNSEHNTNEEFDSHDALAQVEDFQEFVMEIEDQIQDWPNNDLQEAIDSWLDMPSEELGTSVERLDTSYFPDDDTVQSIELRELLSRRRVSGLLRSDFRQSLDQVLQSHVERLVQASDDWELDDASLPASIEQNQEQINGDQALAPSDGAERNSFAPSYPLWDEDLQGANWLRYNSNQQLETEFDVVIELRIDMARLHHRMNDMQNMMEVCMGMQLELQRSIRQELSAALNRSIFSRVEFSPMENFQIHPKTTGFMMNLNGITYVEEFAACVRIVKSIPCSTGVGTCAPVQNAQKIWSNLRGSVQCARRQQLRLFELISPSNRRNQIQHVHNNEKSRMMQLVPAYTDDESSDLLTISE